MKHKTPPGTLTPTTCPTCNQPTLTTTNNNTTHTLDPTPLNTTQQATAIILNRQLHATTTWTPNRTPTHQGTWTPTQPRRLYNPTILPTHQCHTHLAPTQPLPHTPTIPELLHATDIALHSHCHRCGRTYDTPDAFYDDHTVITDPTEPWSARYVCHGPTLF